MDFLDPAKFALRIQERIALTVFWSPPVSRPETKVQTCDVEIQTLENTVQAQAELIEYLTAKGLLGLLQRWRLRQRYKAVPRRLREDELRNSNLRLKAKLRQHDGHS